MTSFDSQWQVPLERSFYARETEVVARSLLGKLLVRRCQNEWLVGRIVETEAYLHIDDPACHASRGMKPRNRVMFGPPGFSYVYAIHAKWCFNIVTMPEGIAAAVLVRAVDPIAGSQSMAKYRGVPHDGLLTKLTSGPSRLCQAMSIDHTHNGVDLVTDVTAASNSLWVADDGVRYSRRQVGCSPRIGVTSAEALLLRYFVVGHPSVSGLKRWHSEYAPQSRQRGSQFS
jgi:DNA-3-methyladenine glycosylase